jgi:pimeloyl-ACP methyl ester carboxylesterase
MRTLGIVLLFAVRAGAVGRTPVPAVESKPHACRAPVEALCATYPVWENRETKAGRRIGLNIVILPALAKDHDADPLFVLDGGPGGAATRLVAGYAGNLPIRNRRDIVLIDQRGTGGSNPLDCDLYGNPPDLQVAVTTLFPPAAVRACREKLSKIADLAMYTTAAGMDDVDEVRQWLGYGKINIWGGSYGSVAAQVYMRRHGASLRSVVLAGTEPVDELNPLHHAQAGQRAVDIIFERCRADKDCNAAYPHLREDFAAMFERVRKGVEVEVHDLEGRSARVRPSVLALAEGIRHALYGDDGRTFPSLIHRAAGGDMAALVQRGVTSNLGLIATLSSGMLLSVTCAEDIPYIDDATLERETANTFLGDLRVKDQRAACREWVRGPVPKDVHDLARSDLPVLFLAGGRDPVTPPDRSEHVAKPLPNSRIALFPESSHGNYGPCGNRLMADFLARGSVQGMDISCAADQKPVRFVIEP